MREPIRVKRSVINAWLPEEFVYFLRKEVRIPLSRFIERLAEGLLFLPEERRKEFCLSLFYSPAILKELIDKADQRESESKKVEEQKVEEQGREEQGREETEETGLKEIEEIEEKMGIEDDEFNSWGE